MKKLVLIFTVLLTIQFGYSQVGINTTNPNAQLDIKSSNQATPANNDGILIPKIDAFPVTNPTAAQNSMMVYLTNDLPGKPKGFYYWDNATTSWKGFAGNSGWELLGNSGTNPNINFIGTTDANDVVFKRNGIRSGLLGTDSVAFGNNALNVSSTGINNLALGAQTLTANSTGYENVAIGSYTLNSNTTGRFNSALGVDALHFNQTGQQNTALGNGAMYSNQTGSANTAVGMLALRSNLSSFYNTALGWQSMYLNTDGTHNTGVGANALFNNTAGIYNTSVGVNSLISNSTGNNNIAMGVEALNNNSSGNDNTAIGTAALKANTVSGNVAVGKDAMLFNINGLYNTASGSYALRGNTNGSYNSAFGYNALYTNTDGTNSGSYNTAFGVNSLYSNTLGGDNIAVGVSSLFSNTTGFRNVAIGSGAMYNNLIGAYSVAVGNYSSSANTNGYNNTAIGDYSLNANTNGFFNVAMGMNSIIANTQSENNTALGYQTMYGMTSGTSNTAIGAWSMASQTAGDYNIAIGRSVNVPSLTGSYQMSIGNVLYGADMSTTALGKIGIGVPVPTEKLEVAGKTKTTNFQMTTGAALNRFLVSDALGNGSWQVPTTALNSFAWTTTGNSGTNPTTNFIGTTDNNDVVFKRNNAKAGLIGGYIAGYGLFSLNANTTGSANAAFGAYSLASNTTGSSNVAVGTDAMSRIQQGSQGTTIGSAAMFYFSGPSGPFTNTNVAIGASAMSGEHFGSLPGSNNIGLNNTAIGYRVLNNVSSGSDNTVQGYNGMYSNTTGNKNTAFGSESLYTNISGIANVAIGYQAAYNETGSNKLYIENSASSTPLIYGEFDTDLIRINGKTEGIYTQLTANGDGQSSIYGYRTRDSQNDGTSYSRIGTNKATSGYNLWGDLYTFGVTGHSDNDFTRTGGVLGSVTGGTYWSSLGYKNSAGTAYGVYATAALTVGTGRMNEPQNAFSIGGGFYGDLIGSWSKGNLIGNINSGKLLASYNNGDEYTSGKQIELVTTGTSKTAAYTVTSTESVVYKKGKIILNNGTARVSFDENYKNLLGEVPVVTITPMGQCNGLYIESIDKDGFVIKELNNGASTISVSWIAVGNRIDATNTIPESVLDKNFDANIYEVMFNENNKEQNAKAIWSDGRNIRFGVLPDNLIEKPIKNEK